ncbi:MAG: glycosyltransferase [Candidatus Omnitrophica bacterium]|nr:glycosyltransferase [Candidatus Omnitrophota bacterium]
MKISVVILTYNRNKLLRKCLDSLFLNQTRLPDEVIIVNSGEEDVDALVKRYIKRKSVIKVVKTANVSLADNRNAGVKASSHDLVAFTDDDCEVCTHWVEVFIRAFNQDENIGSVGGNTFEVGNCKMIRNIERVRFLADEYYDKLNSPFCYYFRTTNACYRKKILENIGLFEDTHYRSFEDVSIGLKILMAGYKNIYYPEISVKHYGRNTTLGLLKRLFEYGRGMYAGTLRFSGMPRAYVFKAQRSVPYIIFSTFAGPVRDVFRFRKKENPLIIICFSFIMKLFVNAGMIYERFIK